TRIGMRVLMPIGQYQAEGAEGLYDAARQVPWEEHLTADSTFAVEANLRDSEHSHSGFVALKIKDAIADRLREQLGRRPDVDTRDPAVRVVAHLAKSTLSLSIDLCGDPLFQRGYRAATTQAPLKPTLAAALLHVVGYDGEQPLLDPMCGSGTIVIEAAMIATRRPPGLARSFAVERSPYAGATAAPLMAELKRAARADMRPAPAPIIGSDKSPNVLELARRNVAAARLSEAVELRVADATRLSELADTAPGCIVTNPPYGERSAAASGQKSLKTFYHQLGDSLGQMRGWRVLVLSGNPGFESAFHRRPAYRRELWNGPIRCELLGYSL
ncbi:MAG TPA: THUMP domain-containing protein, partial [Terriglobales bacterium]|nr:THUMP domain-containing protein [Terriglobales bacterium]